MNKTMYEFGRLFDSTIYNGYLKFKDSVITIYLFCIIDGESKQLYEEEVEDRNQTAVELRDYMYKKYPELKL